MNARLPSDAERKVLASLGLWSILGDEGRLILCDDKLSALLAYDPVHGSWVSPTDSDYVKLRRAAVSAIDFMIQKGGA